MRLQTIFIALVVSLGGFLFGFDAGIISGVMEYAGPRFNLERRTIGLGCEFPFIRSYVCHVGLWPTQ